MLKSLNWLKVPLPIHYKTVSLTCNAFQTIQTSYIHSPVIWVYSAYISLSLSASSLILFEIQQSILSLRCNSSLERTPKIPPSVYSSSHFILHPRFHSSAAFHSQRKSNSSTYRILIQFPCHYMTTSITECHYHVSSN